MIISKFKYSLIALNNRLNTINKDFAKYYVIKSNSSLFYNKIFHHKFCSIIARNIEIPFYKLTYNYSRSSGPGGQNVNKLNTKVEIRFNIENAHWLPYDVKRRLEEMYPNRITNNGEFIIVCQDTRSQNDNKALAEQRLTEIIDGACKPVNERVFEGPIETEEKKELRIHYKKKRSDVKSKRRGDF